METDKKSIIFLGDIHGEFATAAYLIKRANIEDAYIIQCGDFGVGFHKENFYKEQLGKLNDRLVNKNCHMFVLRGNHDDPSWFKHTNNPFDLSNITLVEDYWVLNLLGKKILCVGGAVSIDAVQRVEGKSYWKDEVFVLNESDWIKTANADIVACHISCDQADMFNSFHKIRGRFQDDPTLEEKLVAERKLSSALYDMTKPALWIHGHYHQACTNITPQTTFRSLDINELWELPLSK
jgi:calcineurin-like phosphoesterase family protein